MDRGTYKNIADNFHKARAKPYLADTYIKAARDTVVDLTSSHDGTEIEIDLLDTLNKSFLQVREYFQDEPRILAAVRIVNNYIEKTDIEGLTDFVNSISWDSHTVPYYWKSLSEDAGFDTSDWI